MAVSTAFRSASYLPFSRSAPSKDFFLRLRLGPAIDMRFTPSLKFVHDDSFDTAEHISRLLDDPRVRRDLQAHGEDPATQERPDGDPS